MSNDVEMKDASAEKPEEKKPEEKEKGSLVLADIKQNVHLLERGVATKEARFSARVLRTLPSLRKRITPDLLRQAVCAHLAEGHPLRTFLTSYLGEGSMDVDQPKGSKKGKGPETEVYLQLLVLIHLLDSQRLPDAITCADDLIGRIKASNRRTMNGLAAKSYFYYARAYELSGRTAEIRKELHAALRTCTLRHDDEGQATLINLLLRNYLLANLYDQAHHLVARSTFPEAASNNEWARYLYYLGRISAIQLKYAEAYQHLEQAIRKAPQTSAPGFQQTVYKFSIIVGLLLGQIPDRSIFRQAVLRRPLMPYSELTQAVRQGDLVAFNHTVEQHASKFQADLTYTLILRLRHNVIKTGVRSICMSYSRISHQDICTKLHLDSPEDAEYIVAKAIRDGVVDATIDHKNGWISTKENQDTYTTNEPQEAFNQRIQFCLNVYNESVKAMRYPPNNYNKELESSEERRLREQQEKEWAQEMADEDDF
eukprot:comp11947_c0_seq1/m.6619 comp11947_c0_seq1/g.6619  ORF comp11947_c0_seq1/g.6619 comp11947_c0_seq1/m.6619 type:complete len:483 (-) comp11947_c0_seq1:559-2007(-)